jgi:hypothetical protein
VANEYALLKAPTDCWMPRYEKIQAACLRERGYQVPAIYRSGFVHWGGGVEVQFIFRQFLRTAPSAGAVLIVGATGGRGYFHAAGPVAGRHREPRLLA